MAVIDLENLTRSYGRRRGVEGLSIAVEKGCLFGFLGPNGAGKTTTIRVMLGFLRPTDGVARIFGRDCWGQSKSIKADTGYLPGDLRLPAWMNGESALSIFGAIRGRDLRTEGRKLAERLDLDLKVIVREMSRGMRQKLGLILALAHSPGLLVLDEPTSGLDPLMQQMLQQILRERAQAGHTVFFSSHSLAEVEQLCERVAIVRSGQLVADQSLDALRAQAGHEVMIRWSSAAQAKSLEPPPCLRLTSRNDMEWRGTLNGNASELVAFLAAKPIQELTIGRPDLETLFHRFYESEPEEQC